MASVGLLYVGAVLIVNGLMLLGRVDARAAAPLNLFVGGLQVLTPTYLIFTSGGDPDVVLGASGLYLFGFTYLYVGLNLLGGLDGTGLGWFSAFVACCAVVFAGLNFGRLDDPAFGVIWLYWAVLWGLFFLVLGLKREELTRFTGAVAVVAGVLTCAVPAFLLLSLALYPRLRGPAVPAGPEPAPELREGEAADRGAPTNRVQPNVVEPQRPQESTGTPPSRRRR